VNQAHAPDAEGSKESPAEAPSARDERRLTPRRVILGVIVAGAVAAAVALGREAAAFVPAFAEWVDGLGALGPLAFIAGYAVATVAFVPGSVITLAAGALFGLGEGTAYAFSGAMLGSGAAFLVARHGGRRFVERRIAGDRRFEAIDRAVGRQGGRIVLLLRLSPVFPFVLLNYALGLTRVGLGAYLLAGFGMLPGTLLYVYYGRVIGEVARVAADAEVQRTVFDYLLLGVGLVATLVVTTLITRLARRSLAEATALEEDDVG